MWGVGGTGAGGAPRPILRWESDASARNGCWGRAKTDFEAGEWWEGGERVLGGGQDQY